MHESKISEKELIKLESFDCDLWLFLEWNGNNLNNYSNFKEGYKYRYEKPDSNSFGLCVLSKNTTINVSEIGKEQRPYACDYPKNLISYKNTKIFLAHAPPPVPTCNFETEQYITDFLLKIKTIESPSNILIGDFNTSPFQTAINKIKGAGFKDSYSVLNNIPVGTFGPATWSPKVLKIDYIFHKGKIEPLLVERFSISNSDHSGWVADFKIE